MTQQRTSPAATLKSMRRARVLRLAPLPLAVVVLAGVIPAVPSDVTTKSAHSAGTTKAEYAAVPVAYQAPSSAHPYSDPRWWPLRVPAKVSSVKTNGIGSYHGYWAMDLIASPPTKAGDPVHAAGAGIFHIGAVNSSCRTDMKDAGGTWVWVDHGGGKVSRYTHLDSVIAKEGQLVTPMTMIAKMGHSGDFAPCDTNYLHFEVRIHGLKGERVNPGSLWACSQTTRATWPDAWDPAVFRDLKAGVVTFDSLIARAVTTSRTDDTCVNAPWAQTSAAPTAVRGTRGSERASISWPAPPPGTNRVVVAMETYHPSVRDWGLPAYRTLSSTTRSSAYAGLDNGRRYRWRMTFHNASGNSAWSRYVELTPAAAPTTPRVPRWLTATTSKIRYAWWISTARGTPVTSYTVSIRGRTSSGYSTWRPTTVSASVLNYNWTPVMRGRTYQVRVRANSAVGSSGWSTVRAITVPR
jgi:hypothetical protein